MAAYPITSFLTRSKQLITIKLIVILNNTVLPIYPFTVVILDSTVVQWGWSQTKTSNGRKYIVDPHPPISRIFLLIVS
jgi:hypothetical protein